MNKRTANKMANKIAKGDYGKTAGPKVDYTPRNTHERINGVYVRGKLVCEPRGPRVKHGSFFTPKGTSPEESQRIARELRERAEKEAQILDLNEAPMNSELLS